jgi:chloride channel protein, CIC family
VYSVSIKLFGQKDPGMIRNSEDKWFRILTGKLYNEKVRTNILQALPFWIAALLTGLIAVLYTKLFMYGESLSHSIVISHRWLLFVVTPACFVVAWWIIKRFDENAAGSGIPQVMTAIELANPKYNHLVDKFLSIKGVVVKVMSTLFMIVGGGAIGREGPTVQIAGSIFRKVNNLIPESWPKVSKKNMIMTGAAAGLAAAFNTPLGGIVFAVEELAKTHISYFKTALFTGVIIAGITAQGILGPYLYLGYPDISSVSPKLIFFVPLVACVAGLLGSIMSVIILRILNWKRTFTRKGGHILYVIGCGLLVATIAYFLNDGILGSGKQQMTQILFTRDKHVGFALPFYRIIGSVAAFTTGAAGGIFAPSLAAGATIGGWIAEVFNFLGPNADILILSGMVAFLTGVTRSPFTSAILVLEMTDRHSVVFYLMLAAMAANLFANLIDRHSLYDRLKDRYLNDVYKDDPLKN